MTRYSYAGGAADFVFDVAPSGFLRLRPASLLVWTEESAGVRVTDLRLNGVAVTEVPVDDSGLVPAFEGPDEYVEDLWVATGPDKPRIRLVSNAGEQRSEAAADRAEAALAQAQEVTGLATVEEAIEAVDANPASPVRVAQDARLTATYVAGGARPKHAPALGLFFPEAEGALGNGVADDTAAINAAIVAATAGSRVVLAAGASYKTSGVVITGKTGVTIEGNGATLALAATGARHGVQLSGTCDDVHVTGLRIVGNGVVADAHAGVYISNGATITGCSVTHNRITNVTLGISINFDSTGTLNGWLVEGNDISTVTGTASGYGYGIHVATAQSTPNGARIIGNRIANAQRHSIYQAMGTGTVLAGNTILSHRAGVNDGTIRAAINVLRSKDITITGNTVAQGYDGALNVSCDTGATDGVTVTGNTFTTPMDAVPLVTIGDSGTPTSATRNVAFVGNTLKTTTTGRLLRIQSGVNVLVEANVILYANTGSGSAVEILGSGDTASTAAFNDLLVFRNNLIVMEGGAASNRALRLSGAETSTARMYFLGNIISGAATDFIASVAASNPNIVIAHQGNTGLTFATGVRLASSHLPSVGFHPNVPSAPTITPTAGAISWAEAGAVRTRTSSGTTTTVAGDLVVKTANYTCAATDSVVLATGGASGITITLPTATTKGQRYTIKKTDSAAGAVTVATTSSQTIDGATTKTLAAQYDRLTVVSDGAAWFIVG